MTIAILLATALLAPQPVAAAHAPPDDVVVIGERIRRLKLTTKTDRKTGTTRCIVKRGSGDPSLDATMCDAVRSCAATARTSQAMEACVKPRFTEAMKRAREAVSAKSGS